MPLPIALAFNLNQHLSEEAYSASRICYRGLLRVLRAHPRLRFNLQISGTLVHALSWLDPDPLQVIRDGLADGQFELLAGAYAQNVAAASHDWDNARQIALHREALRAAFGVELAGFWSPDRCWRQSLVPGLADAGFRRALVEDHILHASGAQHPFVFTTSHDGRTLAVVYDDTLLRTRINFAAWFGRPAPVFDYLRRIADRAGSSRFCLAYGEAAEAMGLWGWRHGLVPPQTWANLDALLTQLEAQKWLKVVHLSQAPEPASELTPLIDSAGAEFDRVLAEPAAPGHEPGYAGWADYLARSPKIARFNSLYDSLRARIRHASGEQTARADTPDTDYSPTPASRSSLLQQAVHAMCSHQHRFGTPGAGGPDYRGWQGARAGFVLTRAAELAAKPRSGLWIEDVNGDGLDEVLLSDGRQLAVVSPAGARLLYWFDLAGGNQWVGNQLAVTAAPHRADSPAPELQPRPREWLPETDRADLAPYRSLKIKEEPPTRLGAYLPGWVWDGASRPVTLYARAMQLEGLVQPLPGGRRALNDRVALDGGPALAPGAGDYRVEGDSVAFARFLSPDFALVKRFRLADGAVLAQYRLENHAEVARNAEVHIISELCPDYAEVLPGGRATLEHVLVDDRNPGVRNRRTGRTVVLASSRAWTRLERSEALLALEVGLAFEFNLAPQTAQTFDLRLSVLRFQVLSP